MSTVSLNLPDELQARLTAQARESGLSLDQYVSAALAERVDAQAEVARYFSSRAARVAPGRAARVLARAGVGGPPQPGDEIVA